MICTPASTVCSGSSRWPRYCFPSQIAILAFFSASLHWCLRSDIFPVLRFSLNTSEKVLLYVFLHHELSVLSVMPNQPQISSRVHCNPHRLSNCFWSMFFLGLPVRAILSPFHPLFFNFARACKAKSPCVCMSLIPPKPLCAGGKRVPALPVSAVPVSPVAGSKSATFFDSLYYPHRAGGLSFRIPRSPAVFGGIYTRAPIRG